MSWVMVLPEPCGFHCRTWSKVSAVRGAQSRGRAKGIEEEDEEEEAEEVNWHAGGFVELTEEERRERAGH